MSAGSTSVAPCFSCTSSACSMSASTASLKPKDCGHADARALQAVRIAGLRVVDQRLACAWRGRFISGSTPVKRAEQDRRIAHGAAHRTGSVLRVRNRNDAGAADQADRRLDADEAVSDDGQTMEPSVSVPIPIAARFAEIAGARAGTRARRDCDRARRDSSSGRRARSSRWSNGSSESSPTR